MPMDPRLLYSAAHIVGTSSQGTGFFVAVPSEREGGAAHRYLVTAHHVIDAQVTVQVSAANPFADGSVYPPLPVDGWVQPIDHLDLAVARFADQLPVYATPLTDFIPIIEDGETRVLAPALGSQIFYIGLFVEAQKMLARSGTIAGIALPDLDLGDTYSYVAHLVDCRSYEGFSGSPCFLATSYAVSSVTMEPPLIHRRPGELAQESISPLLHISLPCGMFTAHYDEPLAARKPRREVSKYGIGIMLRSDEIKAALMTDDMRKERRRWEREHPPDETLRPQPVAAVTDSLSSTADLLGNLMQVPKDEARDR